MASEEWQVPVKRVTSTCIKTRAGNRQFVCNNRFEAIAGARPRQEDKTRGRERVMFDCDSDGSTSCGGCEEERGEEQDGSENGSEDTEGCRKDPNLVGIC